MASRRTSLPRTGITSAACGLPLTLGFRVAYGFPLPVPNGTCRSPAMPLDDEAKLVLAQPIPTGQHAARPGEYRDEATIDPLPVRDLGVMIGQARGEAHVLFGHRRCSDDYPELTPRAFPQDHRSQ